MDDAVCICLSKYFFCHFPPSLTDDFRLLLKVFASFCFFENTRGGGGVVGTMIKIGKIEQIQ